MTTKNSLKLARKFECIMCDYLCYKKSDFNKHLLTIKHNNNILTTYDNEKLAKKYICLICKKDYNDRAGLWRHKQKCYEIKDDASNSDSEPDDEFGKQTKLVNYLMKENSEFKQLMIEQNKHMLELAKNTAGHHNTTNNFNLNLFLNETCKNAMNIMDFVSQLQVGIKDLEDTGRLGFAEGISKIFINGLKQIDISDRPVHCSDFKRETLYIKNNNQWNKESDNKDILTNAIKHVAHKNMKQIPVWTKTHSDFNNSSSKENDKYLKIVSESMSGSSQEETDKNYNKIIKNIVKETIIDK